MSNFKLALKKDVDDIMVILNGAKALLKKDGSTQWQSGEPSLETITNDVQNETCFVLMRQDCVLATVNVSLEPDPQYENIEGAWQNPQDPYITLHRFAVHPEFRKQNIANELMDHCITHAQKLGYDQIRVDTHALNRRMIKLLERFEFEHVGMIHVKDPVDSKRLAYQKFIKPS